MRASREGSIARAIGADPSMLESRRLFPQGGGDMKRTLVVGGVIAVVLAVGFYALAQPKSEDKKEMTKSGGKQHRLAAALETVQWGWLDPKEPPKLTVDSGDVVSVETMMHSHDKVKPGITMDEIVALRKANPGGGPHSMTGPIYVNGAEPGDVMEIRILKIVPKNFAINFNLPGTEFPTIGALAPEMPNVFIKFFTLDPKKRSVEFKPGVNIELAPFPGTLAVGIDPNDPAPRKGGVKDDPMAPVEERLEHGHQRAAGREHHLRPDLPQGRPHLDRRLALPSGQRRGQPDRARVLVPRDRAATHRAQGHEARVAAHRDEDALDHDRVRRGPEQGDGQRRPRDRGLPLHPEDGPDGPLRGVLAHVDDRRLPRQPGRGRPQGRALHDPEVGLQQEIVALLRVLALVVTLAATGAVAAGGPVNVVTTSTDLKALVEVVGGDRVRVESLAPPLQDPHTLDLKPGQVASLRAADL